MSRPKQTGMGYTAHEFRIGKRTALKLTANGLEPQAGFGGFSAIAGQTISPRLCHTGGVKATASTDGTERAGSTTTMQLSEVFVPANCTVTGISILNGDTPAGLVKVALFDSQGVMVPGATNATGGAGTTQAGADAYQRIPFLAPVALKGPATYFVATVASTTSPINCHTFGDFGASEVAAVYATAFESTQLTGVVVPSTFTASRGPIASLY